MSDTLRTAAKVWLALGVVIGVGVARIGGTVPPAFAQGAAQKGQHGGLGSGGTTGAGGTTADPAGAPGEEDSEVDTSGIVTINREVFRYNSGGRRDPFKSLLTTTELRPTLADLRLTTVAYDPAGRNSVAILRDLGTKEQYRVKVGTALGRMRVVRIAPKVVTFAIEEFGFSRQETLALGDSTRTRKP